MAHINKVLKSIEADDGIRCVDIFIRPDKSFGFEEFRRDPEDGRGWYPIGMHATTSYETQADAMHHAEISVNWLRFN